MEGADVAVHRESPTEDQQPSRGSGHTWGPDGAAEDIRLLRGIAAGEHACLARLYERRGGALFSMLVRMLTNESEAEEVLQDSFVRIWRRAGDFDPARTLGWIEKYFGPIPKGGKPIPREIPREPAQTGERRTADYGRNTPLPAVVLTYHVPEAGTPDLYALEVASNILSNGESSRLYRRLVYEKQIAVAAGG